MKVALLTRDYGPGAYDDPGAHVVHLARELASLVDVEVHCFGRPASSRPATAVYEPWDALSGDEAGAALRAMSVDLAMAAGVQGADLLHSHGWHTNLAGHLGQVLHGVPHVVTCHRLERLRRWKSAPPRGDHGLARLCERIAVEGAVAIVAVSEVVRDDLLRSYPTVDPARIAVIPDGVDAEAYWPDPTTTAPVRLGVDLRRPTVLFVGRIAHDEGLSHLLEVAVQIDAGAQVVLCAAPPDAEMRAQDLRRRLGRLHETRRFLWVDEALPPADMVQLLSHAAVFVRASTHERVGPDVVEAMACEAPVVAGDTAGTREVVRHGETGYLVPFAAGDGGHPADPAQFARDLARRVNELLGDPSAARRLGQAGRWRVLEQFSWPAVARKTVAVYTRALADHRGSEARGGRRGAAFLNP